jgi:hypothetical protein
LSKGKSALFPSPPRRAERKLVTVLDRKKLELVAGDSYGISELEYARLMTPNVFSEADGS